MSTTEGKVLILDVETGSVVEEIAAHDEYVWSVAWAPGGDAIATASGDGTVRIRGISGSSA